MIGKDDSCEVLACDLLWQRCHRPEQIHRWHAGMIKIKDVGLIPNYQMTT